MRLLQKLLKNLFVLVKSKRFIFFFFITVIFVINAFHESYPDEFDNIAGGWFILHGRLIYSGFFTHHGPVPYYLAAILEIFSGQSFVRFRILYGIFLVAINFLLFYILKKRLGKEQLIFYPLFITFFGIMSTYYWSHMLLADNVAAYSFIGAYILLLIKMITKKPLELFDFVFISLTTALGIYSSLTYLYLYFIILATTGLLYFFSLKDASKELLSKKTLKIFLIFLAPHFFYLFYLLLTGSLKDYIYQNFIFNSKYYIYNYPRPEDTTGINPIRYAIVIVHDFFGRFWSLLIGVKDFGFAYPMNMTMAVANVSLIIYSLLQKNYKVTPYILLWMIYSNVRSNPLSSGEKDYQSAVYIFISFFNAFFVIYHLYKSINDHIDTAKKVIFGFLLLIGGTYLFFATIFLIRNFIDKFYPKYMGYASLIYDRPQIAPILNSSTTKDDYVWVGPFEFEEWFYTNERPATKYQILIPGMGKDPGVQAQILKDFATNRPKVVYFDKTFFILSTQVQTYSKFLIDYLNSNYITLLPYKNGKTIYRSTAPINEGNKADIETKLYIRKDAVNEVVGRLLKKGYLTQTTQ